MDQLFQHFRIFLMRIMNIVQGARGVIFVQKNIYNITIN